MSWFDRQQEIINKHYSAKKATLIFHLIKSTNVYSVYTGYLSSIKPY